MNISRFSSDSFYRASIALLIWMVGMVSTWTQVSAENKPTHEDPVVAMINQEPVSAREYRLVMDRKVALVYSYFKERDNIDDHPGYWGEDSGPTGPLAKLREMVREELVKIKVYQGLAKEKGLIKEITFDAFHENFVKENARRATAVSTGQVIYGPKQYRESAYYFILFGDLTFQLKKAMGKALEPTIDEAAVEKYYEENKASFGDKSFADRKKAILEFLTIKEAGKELDALCATAKAEFDEGELRAIVPRVDKKP